MYSAVIGTCGFENEICFAWHENVLAQGMHGHFLRITLILALKRVVKDTIAVALINK